LNKFKPVTLKEAKPLIDKQMEEVKNELLIALKDNTPVDTGEARSGWYKTKNALKNDVGHIEQLNSGSSIQAPPFFIEKTLLEREGVSPNGTIVTETPGV
jgi:hypothetical protein